MHVKTLLTIDPSIFPCKLHPDVYLPIIETLANLYMCRREGNFWRTFTHVR